MARDPFRQRRRSRLARVLWVLAAMVLLAVAAVAVFGPRIVADRLNPVSVCVAVTSAPGSTPPLESLTVPVI